MGSLRRIFRFSRWQRALAGAAALSLLLVACSLILDRSSAQCSTDDDCKSFGAHPYCRQGVCTESSLGPPGCFFGTPSTPAEFANQCSTAQCETFDNCDRLGLCSPGATLPPLVNPPAIDAGMPADAGADAPTTPGPCIEGGSNTIVITGSSAMEPFLEAVEQLLGQESPPYALAFQSNGSCNGVDQLFNPDSAKRVVKDAPGRVNTLYRPDGTKAECSFGATGVPVDVAISDVFSATCNSGYVPSDQVAEYSGPIQPMTFVVPIGSDQLSISSEMGRLVFGRGNTDASAAPFTDPSLYFVRNSSSGTQQLLARAIDVDAKRWWGIDRGGSSRVRDLLKAVPPSKAASAIGILSTDFADSERKNLRILAYKDRGQTCAYFPDSTQERRDKQNIRDGHYPIWGPVHFYARISGGVPNPGAAAFVTRFTLARIDQLLLDKIIDKGLVPQCAMKVQRTTEMGDLSTFQPQFGCSCYFEARVNGTPSEGCKTCGGPGDCPTAAPACNNGYCEAR
jgi:ABC-type phosphate transport system substrate-binding protein